MMMMTTTTNTKSWFKETREDDERRNTEMNSMGSMRGSLARSSFGKMPPLKFANIMSEAKPVYEMSYHIDPHDVSDDVNADIVVLLTLRADQDGYVREFVHSFKTSGLSKKTSRFYLRFDGEPNRRILNYCKMNITIVDVLSKRDGDASSIFGYLQTQSSQFFPKTTTETTQFILSYDLTRIQSERIGEWMLKHTVEEWRMCLALFDMYTTIRAVGMFPLREKDANGKDFCFDTFWIRLPSARQVLTQLDITEKMEILDCSKNGWFISDDQVEGSKFKWKEEETGVDDVLETTPTYLSQRRPKTKTTSIPSSGEQECVGGVCPVRISTTSMTTSMTTPMMNADDAKQ